MTTTAAANLPNRFLPDDLSPLLPDVLRGLVVEPIPPARGLVDSSTTDPWQLLDHVVGYAVAAEQIIAEQNSRIAELEKLALTDPLTGLCNRRAFEKALADTLDMIRRHGDTAVLVYIDLDRFKPINDLFGHEAGDRLLQHVAKMLSKGLRASDVVARLGGDEFAALLRRADPCEASHRAEMLRASLNSGSLVFKGDKLPMRASLGIHVLCSGESVGQALRQADRAMYADKKQRRSGPV